MFLLNSCLKLDIAAHRALFLPKLQSHFAEFLKESSLAPLRILYVHTCVGFGYRKILFMTVRAFLGSVTSTTLIKNLVFISQL